MQWVGYSAGYSNDVDANIPIAQGFGYRKWKTNAGLVQRGALAMNSTACRNLVINHSWSMVGQPNFPYCSIWRKTFLSLKKKELEKLNYWTAGAKTAQMPYLHGKA
jgi:hypothetical protein